MNSSEKWTALSSDATGVRVLPRDTNGYVFDGMACSYRMARLMLDFQARTYPDRIPALADEARMLNGVHLRRLLGRQPRVFEERGKWINENQPRHIRRLFERTIVREGTFANGRTTFCFNAEYQQKMEQNFHGSKAFEALAKAFRHVPPAPP